MPNWHELDVKDVLAQLQTISDGLTEKEAAYRLEKIGPNELKEESKINPLMMFLGGFKDFLVIILIAATIFSALVGEILDATAILFVVILNSIFSFLQEYKAEKSMEALKKLASSDSTVIRDGKKLRVPSKTLVPGDIVVLEQGDKIPADVRLIDVVDFKVDESAITGESVAVKKTTTPAKTTTLAEMKCMAFMGTVVAYGRATGVVARTGMETEMGKIAHVVQTAGEEDTPLQKALDKFGKSLGVLIIGICIVVIMAGLLRGGNLIDTIIMGIALAIAAIPEGLPAVVTVTLAIGMRHMAKKNAIMRKLHAVETLGSVSIICSDKTGTLTKNEMTIRKIWFNDKTIDVMGSGYEPAGDFLMDGVKVDKNDQLSLLLRAGSLCTNSQLRRDGEWMIVGDPTEGAINVAAEKFGLKKEDIEKENQRKGEIPFTSERKMMSTVNKYESGYILCVKGAPEIVLEKCTKFQFGSKTVDLTAEMRQKIIDKDTEMAGNALRMLAIAYKQTDVKATEDDLIFIGLVGMIDPPRPEVARDVKVCMDAGMRVVMITGDNKSTAMAIARDIGMTVDTALTGEDLNKMNDEQFDAVVESVGIYARVNPDHKARIVDALKKKGHIIAMTGDGINDAPALKKADIGIAMGIKGTDVAKEASDMVLADDNFSTIVEAIRDGRNVFDNIKNFIIYLLSSNVAEVMVVFAAIIIGFTNEAGSFIVPFTAIQLLWINIVTDGLPAVALGTDSPVGDIMKRKPRDPNEKILSRPMLTHILMTGLVITAIVTIQFAYYLPDATKAMTVAFTSIAVLELVNIFKIRYEGGQSPFNNRKLLYIVAASVAVQMIPVYVPFLWPIFGTTSLNLVDIGLIVAGCMAFAVYGLIRIAVLRKIKAGKAKS